MPIENNLTKTSDISCENDKKHSVYLLSAEYIHSTNVGLQPWQKLLLPLLFGINKLDNEFISESIFNLGKLADDDPRKKLSSSLEAFLTMNNSLSERNLSNQQPKYLFFKDEFQELLGILYRDFLVLSQYDQNDTESEQNTPAAEGGIRFSESSNYKRFKAIETILERKWEVYRSNSLDQDESSWHCQNCYAVFSIFQKKHVSGKKIKKIIDKTIIC
jgi:hypothetical protein